ncbi:hypothetical protein JXB41_01515 [Candidatus Woesearchaeota archaeon]|nr:hypothetical protein [Candidatus Woesearchaeota archaeon]
MIDKKADISVRMLVEIILIVLVLLLIYIPIKNIVLSLVIGKPQAGTEKSFDRLMLEINHLAEEEKTIPIYLDNRHKITGYDKLSQKPGRCETDKSCICLCSADGCTPDKNINECNSLDDKFRINGNFEMPPAENILNYRLMLEIRGKEYILSIERAYTS